MLRWRLASRFDRPVKLAMPGYFVTHRLVLLRAETCLTFLSQDTLSSPSWRGTPPQSRCVGAVIFLIP